MPTLFHDIASLVDAVLVLVRHDWAAGCQIKPRFSTQIATARTGLESRAPEFALPRCDAVLSYSLNAAEAVEFRNRLETLRASRLAIPLPCDDALNDGAWSDWRIFAGPTLTYDDTAGTYTVGAGAQARKATLLFCRLRGDPKISPASQGFATVTFEVFEDAPDSLALAANVVTGESATLPDADWAQELTEGYVSQIEYEDIGNGRETVVRGDEATIRRAQRAGFHVTRSEARKLLRFWVSKRGAWQSFTCPLWFEPGSPENATMRFAGDSLAMSWPSPNVATISAEFIEELATIGGVPAQAQAGRQWLYRLQWRGASAVMAYTSNESALTHSSQVYAPQPITHRKFSQTIKPDGDALEITCSNFSGNPFLPLVKLQLERKLDLIVYECDPATPSGAVKIFEGTLSDAKPRGGLMVGTFDTLGGAMKKKIPAQTIKATCNTTLYSTLCGVLPASFVQTGTLGTQAGAVVEVTSASAAAADYFAKGYATFGTGDTMERRAIIRSAPVSGGQELTLHRPLEQTGALAVSMYPGCSGEFGATGCAKFSNQDNFEGSPHRPPYIDAQATSFRPKTGK